MHLTFVCPGMPFNGSFIEQGKSLGGSESACYYVAREMARIGHKVLVFTNEQEGGQFDGVDYAWCGPPSQQFPLGEYVHSFLESSYVDVLILQRALGIHRVSHCAKLAFLWLHDLALVRQLPDLRRDAHLYDGTLAVSNWHRQQIREAWDITSDSHIHVLPNSVDRSLYAGSESTREYNGKELRLLYQSRYERGIDYLVKPGGIMEQLAVRRPGAKLVVCGYANHPDHMRGYYENVNARIAQLPNTHFAGSLSKKHLAQVQMTSDVLVYPGEFEETSCITAMEAQAAGLPMLASATGALPETCGEGAKLVPLDDKGRCDIAKFVDFLVGVDPAQLRRMHNAQLERAETLGWEHSAKILDDLIHSTMSARQRNPFSMLRSMLDKSDLVLGEHYISKISGHETIGPELVELSKFSTQLTVDAAAHYDADHAVSDIERNNGNLDVTQMLRFQEMALHLMRDNPSNLLDYGCQKGHSIWSLAQKYTNTRYTGVDISPRVVLWAKEHCRVKGVDIRFESGDVLSPDFDYSRYGKFDALLLGEVLEHVRDPVKLCNALQPLLLDGCRVVITTPYGDWEGKDFYVNPDAPRYHMHHFERTDLSELFGHNEGFLTTCVPAGRSEREPLGSYVTAFTYRSGVNMVRPIDYDRKLREFVPRQTLSFCALAKNSESTVLRSLMTVRELADEFIIALDKDTTDDTRAVIEKFRDSFAGFRRFVILEAESPLVIGFDEARNRTVKEARGDWILWLDNDEDFVHPERLPKYLRHNVYDGYAVAQHHMSADPAGILTTDWPVRVFRNNGYLRFVGVVHEHPDDIENPNRGPRAPAQLMDVNILHHGYSTEPVRRARFARNFPLIRRDRKQHPDRVLGALLWIRDLAHMCMFELEGTRGRITPQCLEYAHEGLAEWEKLLEARKDPIVSRMIRDGAEFYSTLVAMLGAGFEFEFQMHATKGIPANLASGPRRKGRFLNRTHLEKFLECCIDEQTMKFDSKYF